MKHCKTELSIGYKVFADTLDVIFPWTKITVNTVNQYSYCIAEKDKEFEKALKHSDILLPDGIAITFASSWLYGKKVKKIAGADLHAFLLRKLDEQKGSCFYMGSSGETLERIRKRLSNEYPNIKMGYYSPPFKNKFTRADNEEILAAINDFQPDVLFVGMTAPKQEKWSLKHKDDLQVNGPICAIGAVFDFYAGTVSRPGKVWRDLGLEWMGRLLKEPKRMWKRYIYYGAIFTGHLVRAKALRKSTN